MTTEMEKSEEILNIAFYRFVDLTDLDALKNLLFEKCVSLKLKGSILLSGEGINGSLAGCVPQVQEFQSFLRDHPIGEGLSFKESYSDAIPFQELLIKLKKEIIPIGDQEIKPAQLTGARITPQELKKWLDENRDFEFLDTRNDYEIEFGTFKKAKKLGLRHFRNIPGKLKELPLEAREKPMVMFCTGGIRCEKATVAAMKLGFKDVYQLDGGILKYFEECGGNHFEGECFVFDERIAVDCNLEKTTKTYTAPNQGQRKLGPKQAEKAN